MSFLHPFVVDRRVHNSDRIGHEDGVFSMPIRVYNHDIDSGRVVFMANYFKFLEEARTEWLRTIGINHRVLERQEGVAFVVHEMHIQYHRPAFLDDLLMTTLMIENLRRTSLVLKQNISRNELICEASITTVCVDLKSFRPVKIPASALAIFQTQVRQRPQNN